jgi:hypothetical protein
MLFIPYKKLTLRSLLTGDLLTATLKENIEPYSGFRFDNYRKSTKAYVGKVSDRTFDIRPVFKGQNSFIPFVHGNIEDTVNGSIITLTFRLHYSVSILVTLMICFMIFSVIKYHETFGLIFILFVYLMTIIFFNIEYSKTKNTLEKILGAS